MAIASAVWLSPAVPAAATSSGSGWTLAPAPSAGGSTRPAIDLTLAPGASATDRVVLSNYSAGPLAFIVYPADAVEAGANGGFALSLPNRPTHGVGHWTTTAVHSLDVPPRQAVTFPFTLKVPPGTAPGDYDGGVVAVDVANQNVGSGTVHLKVLNGVGVRIYLHVPGVTHARMAVEDLSATSTVPPFAGLIGTSRARIRFTVANTGNVIEGVTVRVDVVDGLGRTVKQFSPKVLPFLVPGARIQVSEPEWVGLPIAGPQHVHVVLVSGHRRVGATAQVWVVPWGWLLLVVVVLVAGLAAVVRRGRRRSGRRGSPSPVGEEDGSDPGR